MDRSEMDRSSEAAANAAPAGPDRPARLAGYMDLFDMAGFFAPALAGDDLEGKTDDRRYG